ncbi:helix-turn-helix domain-containing protein [Amycolatopsis rubida]|uniref:Helix-turn-helix domain-containing protein n=1 Tax=Amycolatopsis rubida TaxID=112413 RepID=A0ABX0BM14_9PSEU|nr:MULTISPECIES: helix-turn-helix transcriptional regulator [Amycolatopsis]MYW91677.1 helix-turn-helix domain-containing protein [Amycolatopsis rubida]NEC56661.1 helix-turn-helix domain-containing protein [Amycolatopsis rubida]
MTSGTTSVDEARNALGKRLRELRVAAKLSGKQLAESLSWPGSKVSKIENGKQTPTDDDIRRWTGATGAEDQAESLLATLHNLETQHAEWQRVLKAGMKSHQLTLSQMDERTKFYRSFENTVIPGLLQTPEYARSRFAQVVMVHKVPNDINDAVRARMQRQEMLYMPDKRFYFVITEAALHYRLVPPEVMIGQLDRLMAISTMRNVKLGVIGFKTQYATDPRHGFMMLDDFLVRFESYSAELNLKQPHELELYASIFEHHAAVASYGAAARTIIGRVMEELAAEADESGA